MTPPFPAWGVRGRSVCGDPMTNQQPTYPTNLTNTPRECPHRLINQPGRACRALPPALAGGGGVAVGLSGVRPGKANGQTANDIIRRQDLTDTATLPLCNDISPGKAGAKTGLPRIGRKKCANLSDKIAQTP